MSALWQGFKLLVLLVVVTGVGLVAGAFVMSPAVSQEHRIMGAVGLGGVLLLWAVGYGLLRMVRWAREALRQRRQRSARTSVSAARSSGKSRTPRTVQALAAAGAAPTEIARKMGLPVDAVAMLLEISGPVAAAR